MRRKEREKAEPRENPKGGNAKVLNWISEMEWGRVGGGARDVKCGDGDVPLPLLSHRSPHPLSGHRHRDFLSARFPPIIFAHFSTSSSRNFLL